MLALRPLAIAAMLAWTGFAQAADAPGYVMDSAVTGVSTDCADRYVLNRIKSRFAWAERNTWHRGFVMDSLENPRPSGHPYAEPGLIARDFCVAEAVMTNGEFHTVYYAVEHGVGFAGIGRYVDFCVLGLDPWHVHDGACRTVR